MGRDLVGPSIIFEGCGFAFSFGLGVVKYLQETYVVDSLTVYSISAGCFAALMLVLGLDPLEFVSRDFENLLAKFTESTPCYGTLGTLAPLVDALESILPEGAHKKCQGRLRIVVSRWPCLGFEIVSEFPDRSTLIQAVITSCSFPFFAWRPRCIDGRCEFDAGFQSILTPIDDLVDVAVRPMPVVPSCLPKSQRAKLVKITDPEARRIGHKLAFETSMVPLGSSVWPGDKPVDFHSARQLFEHARLQASTSPILKNAFENKLQLLRNDDDDRSPTGVYPPPTGAHDVVAEVMDRDR